MASSDVPSSERHRDPAAPATTRGGAARTRDPFEDDPAAGDGMAAGGAAADVPEPSGPTAPAGVEPEALPASPEAHAEPLTTDEARASDSEASDAEASASEVAGDEERTLEERERSPLADFDPLAPYRGAFLRFFTVYRHVAGLLMGGYIAYVRSLPPLKKKGLRSPGKRLLAWVLRFFVRGDLVDRPFPKQLRRRLEILGPTFTKLGQVLAIREDLLPKVITRELESLLDHLPPIPYEQIKAILERQFGQPADDIFATIDPDPLGSASIAQAHRAVTHEGDEVVFKVIKPGIREVITSDLKLLELFGYVLDWIIPRYRPSEVIEEFAAYTRREVDYTFEADNAEVFATNFQDDEGINFPSIYRHLCTEDVLTMEFLRGLRPGSPASLALSEAERKRAVDLGAASIIRMLYRDGFFHADLHAGNLKIMPGDRPEDLEVGFIDLGMVGRFGPKVKRRLLYYFYALVRGDTDNAARYLLEMARVAEGGDPQGFRRAVSDMARHFKTMSAHGGVSIAQLILRSLSLGGRYRVFFPVEMTLMVKALVTFEGVGRTLDPELDIIEVSQRHIRQIFRERFDPRTLGRELLSNAPEMIDLAVEMPQLLATGYSLLEEHLNERTPRENPLEGLRSGIMAGACVVAATLAAVQGGPLWLWIPLFLLALGLALFGK